MRQQASAHSRTPTAWRALPSQKAVCSSSVNRWQSRAASRGAAVVRFSGRPAAARRRVLPGACRPQLQHLQVPGVGGTGSAHCDLRGPVPQCDSAAGKTHCPSQQHQQTQGQRSEGAGHRRSTPASPRCSRQVPAARHHTQAAQRERVSPQSRTCAADAAAWQRKAQRQQQHHYALQVLLTRRGRGGSTTDKPAAAARARGIVSSRSTLVSCSKGSSRSSRRLGLSNTSSGTDSWQQTQRSGSSRRSAGHPL